MANPESKKLAVDVIARVDKLEKAMARAANATKRGTEKMESSVKRARQRIETDFGGMATKVSALTSRAFAPLVAGGIVAGLRGVASGVAEIGDQAERAGIGVEAFQELKYVAEQNRIGVDSLTDGLKELNLRADEFIVTGAGPAAEAFQRLGYDAETLSTKLEDPSALFTEIIGKLGQLDQAAQIRIADEIFGGTGGEKFVQLIEQGERGLERTIQEARNLGIVMDSEVIDKAAELDRKFNTVANTVGTALKTAIVEASFALADFINSFRSFEDQQTRNLEHRLEYLQQHTIAPTGKGQTPAILDEMRRRQDEEIAAIEAILKNRAMDELRTGLANLPSNRPAIVPVAPGDSGGGSGGSRSGATSAIAQQKTAVAALIEQLEFEKSLIGLTNVEREIENRLREAGAAATPEQRMQIEALVTAMAVETAAIEASAAAMEQFGAIAQDALGAFIDDMIAGKDLAESFSGVLRSLASSFISMGIRSLTGGLFGGFGFADGGYTGPGGKYEPAGVVHRGEYVFSKRATERIGVGNLERLHRGYANGGYVGTPGPVMGGGGPREIHVTVGVSTDGNGNLLPFVESVADQRVKRAAPVIVGAAVKQANSSAPSVVGDANWRYGSGPGPVRIPR